MSTGAPAFPATPLRPAPPLRQIPALTGVRALAAFLVFFHHNQPSWLQLGPLALWWELHIGVTLFFVLSGFMITWRYDRRGPARESFLRGYFVNRVARIYPLYVFLVVPTMLLHRERSPAVWATNLTVFSCFKSGIPQAWSLRVEECFYLAAPLLFLLWRRHPLAPLAAGAALLAVCLPFAHWPPVNLLVYTFPGRFFEFYVGIWLAKRAGRTGVEASRGFPIFTVAGAAGIAASVVGLAAIHTATGKAYTYGLYHPAGLVLNNVILPILIAAFYWGLIREASLLRRLLSTRFAELLGRSSYALYLIHFGILRDVLLAAFVFAAARLGAAPAAWATRSVQSVAGAFLLLNAVSILLYKGIEAPANRFFRRRFGGTASLAPLS